MNRKKLILVVSPPASGKTFISKKIAENMHHIVYLDKDTLIPLSRKIFEAAGHPFDRSSDFFETWVRNPEYDVILDLAFDALTYEDNVLVNAPFTRELHDAHYIKKLRARLHAQCNASLVIIWVQTAPEVCHQRMIERNSDRDTWKLEHWDEYVKTIDYDIPPYLLTPTYKDCFFIFQNSSDEEYAASMHTLIDQLEAVR
ncbi:MAG: AAA family ATPase [Gemmiger sp.]|nr:AAA family ATPase [Gemmiger sp.]